MAQQEEGFFSSVQTFFFGKPLTPEEMVKKWRKDLTAQSREVNRNVRALTREENKIKREITTLVKRGDQSNARTLARELIRSGKAKERMHMTKAQINSVSMQLQQNLATYKMAGCLKRSADIMELMNHIVRLPELQQTMVAMAREMEKAGLIDEIVEETMDDIDEIEDEEVEEQVDKVLTELNLELKQVPGVRAGARAKQPVAEEESEEEEAEEEKLT